MNNVQKTALVTGSSGYLGSLVCKELKQKGYFVIGLDLISNLKNPEYNDWYYYCDLTNKKQIENIFKVILDVKGGIFDVVFHCAATVYGIAGFHEHGDSNVIDDIQMTQNLVWFLTENYEAIKTNKFVFTSSSMVYETCNAPKLKEEMTEDCPFLKTDYGLSKLVNERIIKSVAKKWGDQKMNYTIYRPFNIINPNEIRFNPLLEENKTDDEEIGFNHVFSDFIYNIVIKKNSNLKIIGDGSQIRCFSWCEDIARCMVDNIENPATKNETFNIGSTHAVNMKQLAELIRSVAMESQYLPFDFPALTYETIKSYSDDVITRIPDVSKAKKTINWYETFDLKSMLRQCIIQADEEHRNPKTIKKTIVFADDNDDN